MYQDAPVCWEQSVLLVLVQPFYWIGVPVGAILRPLYTVFAALKLPLLLIVLVLSAVWAVLAGFIYLFCRISLALPFTRPVSFALALPFLFLALLVVIVAPVPSLADADSKMVKWQYIEKFPYSAEIIRG